MPQEPLQVQLPPSAATKPAIAPLEPELIPVQSGTLTLPYRQLGVLEYVEPFSPRAIDQDHINDRLRTMAAQKWGSYVDAIVGVNTSLSADADQVTVSARVVKVMGDCSFCRHTTGISPGQ
jgi:hypothetical protein